MALEPAQCCLCGDAACEPIGIGEDFEYRTSEDSFLVFRCGGCGLVFLNPRPAVSEFERIYPANYHAFDFSAEEFGFVYKVRSRLEARRVLSQCKGLPDDARILDVGCGDGFHLRLLRDYGKATWTCAGVDCDARAVQAARRSGLEVHHGTLDEANLPPGSFDLVFMVQTIEHVDDPLALVRSIARVLKPGGRLVIVTDNSDSLDFKIFQGRHWGGYHFPRHWYLFNKSSMRRLADRAGLEVARLSTIVSPVNWTYSLRNLLDDWGAPRWVVNRFSLHSPVTLAVFTLFDWVHRLLGRGALLRTVLRKPQAEGER